MTGTIGARIIGFLVIPVLARLYSPESFGTMTIYGTLVMVIGTVSCGCYEQAIVLPKEDREAWTIFLSGNFICLCIFFGSMVLLFFFNKFFSDVVFKDENSIYIWLIPFGALIYGIEMTLNFWQTRKAKFKILSLGGVSGVAGKEVVRLGCGATFGDRVFGLIGGLIARDLVVISVLGKYFYRNDFRKIKKFPTIKEIKYALKRYKDFPCFKCPASLLAILSRNLIVFMLAYLYDNRAVGAFGFAQNLLSVPIGVVGKTIRQVFLQKIATLRANKKKLSFFFLKTTITLFSVGIFPFSAVLFWGPDLFVLLFGAEWIEAGEYSQILTPWLFSLLINQPSYEIFTVLKKQKSVFFYTLITTISRIFVFVIGYYLELKVYKLLMIFSIVNTSLNFLIMFYAYWLARMFDLSVRKMEIIK